MIGTDALDRERDLHRQAEKTGQEFLWIWELEQRTAMVGRSGDIRAEVNSAACEKDGIPVLRRDSGGGTVLLGRGCLSYSLILQLKPAFQHVENSYRLILKAVCQATGIAGVIPEGSDLIFGGKKFGGASQRRLKRTLLHHGTILYAFDLSSVERYLPEPSRQPKYRQQRTHAEFLTNVPLDGDFATRLQAKFPAARPVS